MQGIHDFQVLTTVHAPLGKGGSPFDDLADVPGGHTIISISRIAGAFGLFWNTHALSLQFWYILDNGEEWTPGLRGDVANLQYPAEFNEYLVPGEVIESAKVLNADGQDLGGRIVSFVEFKVVNTKAGTKRTLDPQVRKADLTTMPPDKFITRSTAEANVRNYIPASERAGNPMGDNIPPPANSTSPTLQPLLPPPQPPSDAPNSIALNANAALAPESDATTKPSLSTENHSQPAPSRSLLHPISLSSYRDRPKIPAQNASVSQPRQSFSSHPQQPPHADTFSSTLNSTTYTDSTASNEAAASSASIPSLPIDHSTLPVPHRDPSPAPNATDPMVVASNASDITTDESVAGPIPVNANLEVSSSSSVMDLDTHFSVPATLPSATFTFSRLEGPIVKSAMATPVVSPTRGLSPQQQQQHSVDNSVKYNTAPLVDPSSIPPLLPDMAKPIPASTSNAVYAIHPHSTASSRKPSVSSSRSISGSDGDSESGSASSLKKEKKHKKSKHLGEQGETQQHPLSSKPTTFVQKTPHPSSTSSSTSSKSSSKRNSPPSLFDQAIRPKEPRFRQITNEDDIESIFRSVPLPDSDSHDEDYREGGGGSSKSRKKERGVGTSHKKGSGGSGRERSFSSEKLEFGNSAMKGKSVGGSDYGGFSSPAPYPPLNHPGKLSSAEKEDPIEPAKKAKGTPSPLLGALSKPVLPSLKSEVSKKSLVKKESSTSNEVKPTKLASSIEAKPLKKEPSVQSIEMDEREDPPSDSDPAHEESSDEERKMISTASSSTKKASVPVPKKEEKLQTRPPQKTGATRGRKPGIKNSNAAKAAANRGDVIMVANKAIPYSAINNTDRSGRTPLFKVSGLGDTTAVTALIRAGADVNAKDHAGWSPIHEACLEGQLQTATQLITYGADVNALGFENQTPLHDAVASNHYDVVELLLSHGASLSAKNKDGHTPMDEAEDDETMTKLLQLWQKMMTRVVAVDEHGLTHLHNYCTSGDLKGVQRMLKYGAEVDFPCHAGWTPLHEASSKGFSAIVKELCRYGADVNAKAGGAEIQGGNGKLQETGITPLMDAASGCHLECVKILLEFGANAEATDSGGKGAVDYVTSANHVADEIIAMLERPRASWKPFTKPDFIKTKPGCAGGMMAHIRDQASAMLDHGFGASVSTKDPKYKVAARKTSVSSDTSHSTNFTGAGAKSISVSATTAASVGLGGPNAFSWGGLDPREREGPFVSSREERKFNALLRTLGGGEGAAAVTGHVGAPGFASAVGAGLLPPQLAKSGPKPKKKEESVDEKKSKKRVESDEDEDGKGKKRGSGKRGR
ncbi:UNVERIFIED_CONTAM: Set3 complex subunit with deacetylase activity, meiotic-specific repressor of sporulation proteins, partial [Siphonaria sp. JEL0065]